MLDPLEQVASAARALAVRVWEGVWEDRHFRRELQAEGKVTREERVRAIAALQVQYLSLTLWIDRVEDIAVVVHGSGEDLLVEAIACFPRKGISAEIVVCIFLCLGGGPLRLGKGDVS